MTSKSEVITNFYCPFNGEFCRTDAIKTCAEKNCPTFEEAKNGKFGYESERRARAYCPDCGIDRAYYYKMFNQLHNH